MSLSLANPMPFCRLCGGLSRPCPGGSEKRPADASSRAAGWLPGSTSAALLPLLKAPTLVLVFTPTLLNSGAERPSGPPAGLHCCCHARPRSEPDIRRCSLTQSGRLQGASLLKWSQCDFAGSCRYHRSEGHPQLAAGLNAGWKRQRMPRSAGLQHIRLPSSQSQCRRGNPCAFLPLLQHSAAAGKRPTAP